jgi:hypothetical protein
MLAPFHTIAAGSGLISVEILSGRLMHRVDVLMSSLRRIIS